MGVGNDWTQVGKYDVTAFLVNGVNTIAIEGVNTGKEDNPASLLFSMQIYLKGNEVVQINSDKTWKSTAVKPTDNWMKSSFNDNNWQIAHDYGFNNWSKLLDFRFNGNQDEKLVRASLVKQNPFLKALGRPDREIVVSKREEQATLLQSLELTNGTFFNNVLNKGGLQWLKKYGNNNEAILEALYQKLLGRNPSVNEKEILLTALGKQPNVEQIQDVFWAVLISPEFQFIN